MKQLPNLFWKLFGRALWKRHGNTFKGGRYKDEFYTYMIAYKCYPVKRQWNVAMLKFKLPFLRVK